MNNDRIEVNNLPILGNTFPSNFLYKHAGRIMQYPDFAIIELVANCWDAGATSINIHWPKNEQDDLVVEDNGIGIPKKDQNNVGKKFFRAGNSISVAGTGIGIYLTKNFIDLLEGKLIIESKENSGTTVTIILKI